MVSRTSIPLASAMPDVGPGSVWPVAVLCSSSSAAMLAAGAWVGSAARGAAPTFGFVDWIALHGAWGLCAGVLVSAILAVGGRLDPALSEPSARRAAAVRLGVFGSTITLVVTAVLARAAWFDVGVVVVAMLAGFAALLLLARWWLSDVRRCFDLPRLDPLKVVAFVALLVVPLQDGGAPASLRAAWQVMLGR